MAWAICLRKPNIPYPLSWEEHEEQIEYLLIWAIVCGNTVLYSNNTVLILTYYSAYFLQNQYSSVLLPDLLPMSSLFVTPFFCFHTGKQEMHTLEMHRFAFMTFKLEVFKGMKTPAGSILFYEYSKGNKLITSICVSANLPKLERMCSFLSKERTYFFRKFAKVNLEKLCGCFSFQQVLCSFVW